MPLTAWTPRSRLWCKAGVDWWRTVHCYCRFSARPLRQNALLTAAYQPTAAAAADRSFAASPPARKKTLKMYKTWDKNCETCERARQPNSMTLKENRRVKKCRQGKQFTWGIQTRVPCVKHYTQINNNMNNNTQIAKVRDKDITCLTMKSEKGDYRNVHHRSQ